ncbi:MAG: 2-amino-4-hydroxy-6-hydroxymethyldihydropteridine diphosphokinase [Hyphomonadaceae bacterium]
MEAERRTFVALGANLPLDGVSGAQLLARAVGAMRAEGLVLRTLSGVWETEAWPQGSGQPDYHNAVAVLNGAGLEPQPLYRQLSQIERKFGRERREKWAPRTLDLDIITMDGFVGTFGGIDLPHPRMQDRAFVLAPLAEIAPDWRHPVSGRTAIELLAALAPGYRYRRIGDLSQAAQDS